ncbi:MULTISPECIES: membrane integrity-associated transporter subunit PqiC [unclassified Herbaspirillum]|uniref:PqiC family protein n=1 Tax=unclassified Herbaspirillum TaxID=2624150 RepID=UPI0011544EEE|nr:MULTISPECIES: PqiC family protein [unclassified Herbaspirillum]
MMSPNKNSPIKCLAAASVAAMLLAACGTTPPAQFYTLAATPASAASAASAVDARPAPGAQTFIEMLPVAVPERLARPQVVVRSDAAKLDVLEQDRWSSPFNNELRDALAAGIASRLDAIDISRSARPPGQVSYRIAVELRDLDAVRNGQVRASFGWSVTRSDDRKTAVCRLAVTEPVAGNAISDVVVATQKVVAAAADAIAGNVRALQAGQAAKCLE